MKYEVLTYGRKELKRKATPVETFDEDLSALARDMLRTMYAAVGVGLAANQIGRPENLCVIDVPPDQDTDTETRQRMNPDVVMPLIMANPRIESMSGERVCREGCLSFPDVNVMIRRANEIVCSYRGLDGKPRTVRAVDLLARAIQHEADHLNGILLVDRMSTVQRLSLAGRLRRLKTEAEAAVPA